jgi:hypothetical protein
MPIDMHYVDELIAVRRRQHGGLRGAPPVVNGYREGGSLNRSCIVMLSALIQGFVEDVFIAASTRVLRNLANADALKKYRTTFSRWGNPNPENLVALFARIGIEDVWDGLSWRNCANLTVRARLRNLNQLRNDIAHGHQDLRVDGTVVSLSLAHASGCRDFAEQFGVRFESHVTGELN